MTTPDIIDITFKVVKVFEKCGIAYQISGSLASSAFGIPRATMDVDIVADVKLKQVDAIVELLKEEFYVDTEMVNNAIKQGSCFNLIHLETMFKVDVFILKDRPFDQQAFLHKVKKIVSTDSSQQLFFASPEDIILNKLEWYKAGAEVSERQWADILGILKVQGKDLDMAYLKKWANELGLTELLNRAIDDARLKE